VLSWPGESTWTACALRRDFQLSSSLRSTTTSTCLRSLMAVSSCTALLVDGTPAVVSEETTWMRPLRARSDRAPRRAATFIFLGVRWL